jgi:hypothetical protein
VEGGDEHRQPGREGFLSEMEENKFVGEFVGMMIPVAVKETEDEIRSTGI